jgi:hypothetical protein
MTMRRCRKNLARRGLTDKFARYRLMKTIVKHRISNSQCWIFAYPIAPLQKKPINATNAIELDSDSHSLVISWRKIYPTEMLNVRFLSLKKRSFPFRKRPARHSYTNFWLLPYIMQTNCSIRFIRSLYWQANAYNVFLRTFFTRTLQSWLHLAKWHRIAFNSVQCRQ